MVFLPVNGPPRRDLEGFGASAQDGLETKAAGLIPVLRHLLSRVATRREMTKGKGGAPFPGVEPDAGEPETRDRLSAPMSACRLAKSTDESRQATPCGRPCASTRRRKRSLESGRALRTLTKDFHRKRAVRGLCSDAPWTKYLPAWQGGRTSQRHATRYGATLRGHHHSGMPAARRAAQPISMRSGSLSATRFL
jgi:hypothetical protein